MIFTLNLKSYPESVHGLHRSGRRGVERKPGEGILDGLAVWAPAFRTADMVSSFGGIFTSIRTP